MLSNTTPLWLLSVQVFFLGACIGSFLNVVIYRIPIGPARRASGSIFNLNSPRSHCPICLHQLAWYENIPLLSWVIQVAKCRKCKAPIPSRYPLIELLVAGTSLTAWTMSQSWTIVILVMGACATLTPTAWWLVHHEKWNKPMLWWNTTMFFCTLTIGGYAWSTK